MNRSEKKWFPFVDTGVASAGMCLFALFAHSALPQKALSACGLLLTVVAVLKGLKMEDSPAAVLGMNRFSPVIALYILLGSFLGITTAFLYRWGYGTGILLTTIGKFAPVAALIGATEEMLYRGYIQGRVNRLDPFLAMIFASLCHTLYKCMLFALPPFPIKIDFIFFATLTFAVGTAFAALRLSSKSVLPALCGHACFDIIAYGEYSHAPWWVWS